MRMSKYLSPVSLLLAGALPLGPLALLGLPTFVATLLLRSARALLLGGTGALLLLGGALAGRSALLHGAALLLLICPVGARRCTLRGALWRLGARLWRRLRRGHALRWGAHARRRRLLSGAASAAGAALSATGLALGTLSGGKTRPSD